MEAGRDEEARRVRMPQNQSSVVLFEHGTQVVEVLKIWS